MKNRIENPNIHVYYLCMLNRSAKSLIAQAIDRSPITALIGPRQCGKTTLARQVAAERASTFFDLELPQDMARLENADLALSTARGLVIIDEIQRKPELFGLLRVPVDRNERNGQFLMLGSASPDIVTGVSECPWPIESSSSISRAPAALGTDPTLTCRHNVRYFTYMFERALHSMLASSKRSLLLLGPRQVGKSTLLRSLSPDRVIDLSLPSEYRTYLGHPDTLERELEAVDEGVRTMIPPA